MENDDDDDVNYVKCIVSNLNCVVCGKVYNKARTTIKQQNIPSRIHEQTLGKITGFA